MSMTRGWVPQTLMEFVKARSFDCGDDGKLCRLVASIEMAVKRIRPLLVKATTQAEDPGIVRLAEQTFAEEVFASRVVSVVLSSQSDEPLIDKDPRGLYLVAVDPLNGSDLLDALVPTGTLFSIYANKGAVSSATGYLRQGSGILAAGYALYGFRTIFVLAMDVGDGAHEFTLDHTIGEFVLTKNDLVIPRRGTAFSVDDGDSDLWDRSVAEFVQRRTHNVPGRRSRYHHSGSFVLDSHHAIRLGGIYLVPANERELEGRVSLMFEAGPIAFIVREAGGMCTTGDYPVLEVMPTTMHDTISFFVGSIENITELLEILTLLRATEEAMPSVSAVSVTSL